jgi:hypothetical protein
MKPFQSFLDESKDQRAVILSHALDSSMGAVEKGAYVSASSADAAVAASVKASINVCEALLEQYHRWLSDQLKQ